MRDRLMDLGSTAGSSATPASANDEITPANGGGGGNTHNSAASTPAVTKKSTKKEKAQKTATVGVADAEGGESEAMKAFFGQIESIRDEISMVKKLVDQIDQAHQSALNIISEDQSAQNTKELDKLMDRVNKTSTGIRDKLKVIENENKKMAKEKKTPQEGGEVRIRISQYGAVAKKFLDVMMEYKDIQKKYQDKYKQRMQRQYLIVKPTASPEEIDKMINDNGETGPVFAQPIVHAGQKAEAKRAIQDIKDRHADVQRLEKSIIELQQLFIDMSVLVAAQGELINQIEIHVEDAIDQTEQGVDALHKAVKLQKKTRKKMCVIILLLILVCVIIALGVYFGVVKK